ncbi:AAA family ATPase [Candidatus Parcubacteria bacterium]|nr:AAA family ATPase [Candidatus Parcubacteria bacterium]
MKIKFVEIQNFRKLKSCRIDFSDKETVFVGANNSGKTSAMDALIFFLKEKQKFSTKDFTLSNWKEINEIGRLWIEETDVNKVDFTLKKWEKNLPQLDIWINVDDEEIHYVSDLIPTLNWQGGLLGVRLRLEPKNIKDLYKNFKTAFDSSINATEGAQKLNKGKKISLKLWPATMWDFLVKKLKEDFTICTYILDPKKITDDILPQKISVDSIPLDNDVLRGLIKIDIINAQRGFSDSNSDGAGSLKVAGSLSFQLREYYEKHLDPFVQPEPSDIKALQAMEDAKTSFDFKLKESFNSALSELELLNYPGLGNPSISISSKINAIDGISHSSAVQFNVLEEDGKISDCPLSLPEKYNGLGYQNLISIIFKLIRFRDEWMQVGKSLKQSSNQTEKHKFEPLHLVLVEEPEAHLHAQIQQVFIRKAYEVLRNNTLLHDKKQFTTQLIVSTHSNHIAYEIDFTSLCYFKRNSATEGLIPTSTVVNLSETFGKKDETTKFAIRYLKTTHCDLFFADAVILIEGPAEKMLVPYFIKRHLPELSSCYISLLEIGGNHAHTLKPLIEKLGLITLIITDIDSVDKNDKNRWVSVLPEKNKDYKSGNDTLKKWLPGKDSIDDLLNLEKESKESSNFPIRVAYQFPIKISTSDGKTEEVIPYTFEDSLVFENLKLFKELTGTGLMKKMSDAVNKKTVKESSADMFNALKTGKKAKFALELLFLKDPKELAIPNYIKEGLEWLREKLQFKKVDTNLNKERK